MSNSQKPTDWFGFLEDRDFQNSAVIERVRQYIVRMEKAEAELAARFTSPIVCLCGSTRFKQTYISEYARLTDEGNIVLSVGRYMPQAEQDLQPELKQALDDLHLRKLDLCDWVWVLNVGGYVGDSTRREIEYAQKLGRKVCYLSQEFPDYVEPKDPSKKAEAELAELKSISHIDAALKIEGKSVRLREALEKVALVVTRIDNSLVWLGKEWFTREAWVAIQVAVDFAREALAGKQDDVIADLDAIPGLKKQAWDSYKELVEAGIIRDGTHKDQETRCKMSRYEKFVRHIEAHLKPGQVVVCKICGKSVEEIEKENDMWKKYRKSGLVEMRPYVDGEDLTGVSLSERDTPGEGGMIARNIREHADRWYVAEEYFLQNYEEAYHVSQEREEK